jgi:restriction system protein
MLDKDGNQDSSAQIVELWREYRQRAHVAAAMSQSMVAPLSLSESVVVGLHETADVRRLDAESVSYETSPGSAEFRVSEVNPPVELSPPELLVGIELIRSAGSNDEGAIIAGFTPVLEHFLSELADSSNAYRLLTSRQAEEFIAGLYHKAGWRVTLTPQSGDHGRDVIATRDDVGPIRILDQVKWYKPGHRVTAEQVFSMYGVLAKDQAASKAVITTTSTFAPGVEKEFSAMIPTRLELRDGRRISEWVKSLIGKTK